MTSLRKWHACCGGDAFWFWWITGLELEDATAFLKADAVPRQAQQILTAPLEQLAEINAIAGGASLALKLVVAQTLFLDLEQVRRGLRQAQGDLYPFTFRQSWEQLSLAAQRVLICIGRTVVTTVGWEELAAVGVADNETELATAIRQLVAYSLMEVTHVAGKPFEVLAPVGRIVVRRGRVPDEWHGNGNCL